MNRPSLHALVWVNCRFLLMSWTIRFNVLLSRIALSLSTSGKSLLDVLNGSGLGNGSITLSTSLWDDIISVHEAASHVLSVS